MSNIDLEEGITEQNHDYIIDWLGNKKTPKEIKERNERREICLQITLILLYLIISLICFILMSRYPSNSPLFIIPATIVSILWGIPGLTLIGLIFCAIIMWIISLI